MDDAAVQWYQHVVAALWHCAVVLTAPSVPQEHQTLMEEGYKHEAKAMRLQIERLQEEKKNIKKPSVIRSGLGMLCSAASLFLPGVAGKVASIISNLVQRML